MLQPEEVPIIQNIGVVVTVIDMTSGCPADRATRAQGATVEVVFFV